MSRKSAAAQREENLLRLQQLAQAANAPGNDQANQALASIEPEVPSPPEPPEITVPEAVPPPPVTESVPKSPPTKPAERSMPVSQILNTKAEKISISLHPQDQERLSKIENALRVKGLIGRTVSTSFLLKIALAAFDEGKVRDLKAISEGIQAQDQRGKWMK